LSEKIFLLREIKKMIIFAKLFNWLNKKEPFLFNQLNKK